MNTAKKLDSFYFRFFPWVVVGSMSVIIDRLSMMQTNGLAGFGGAFVAALFAITSVMYGRARASSEAKQIEVRSQIADECLILSLIGVMGLMVTFFVFFDLSERYMPRPGHLLSSGMNGPEILPTVSAFLCIIIFVLPMIGKIIHIVDATADDLGLNKSLKKRKKAG